MKEIIIKTRINQESAYSLIHVLDDDGNIIRTRFEWYELEELSSDILKERERVLNLLKEYHE